MGDCSIREVNSCAGNSTRDISFKWVILKFNMGNHFNYACIRHLALKGPALTGIVAPLDSKSANYPSGDQLVNSSPLDSTKHALIHPLVTHFLVHTTYESSQNVPILSCTHWVMHELFGSWEDCCKPKMNSL